MTTTPADLADFTNTATTSVAVYRAHAIAVAHVAELKFHTTPPDDAIDEAVLEVGASILRRRAEPSQAGAVGFTQEGSVPVRQPRDPMAVARGVLARWLEAGIG